MGIEAKKSNNSSSSNSKNVKKIEHSEYTLWLPEEINELSAIEDILSSLYEAEEGDRVNLHIGGYGGSIFLGLKLLAAMRACQGELKHIIDAPVHSMHTIIAVNGENLEITPSAYFHFHSMSYMAYGKQHEIKSQVEYMEEWAKDLDRRYLSHILSKQELEEIAKGKELYLSYDEMSKRLTKLMRKGKK